MLLVAHAYVLAELASVFKAASYPLRPLYGRYATERRQKFVNIDAMASTFESLPPEIVQKCVEFLDFDLVSGDLRARNLSTPSTGRW